MMVQEVRLKVVFIVECCCEAHKPCHKADRLLIDFAHSHMKRKSCDFSTVFSLCCSRSRSRIAQLLLACTQVFIFCAKCGLPHVKSERRLFAKKRIKFLFLSATPTELSRSMYMFPEPLIFSRNSRFNFILQTTFPPPADCITLCCLSICKTTNKGHSSDNNAFHKHKQRSRKTSEMVCLNPFSAAQPIYL